MGRWYFWELRSSLRGQIASILPCCHCTGWVEKNDWWIPGAIQWCSSLPEIGHTGDSDTVNIFISQSCHLFLRYGKRAEGMPSIWISRWNHCQLVQPGLLSSSDTTQSCLPSVNIYWVPALCQWPRVHWQSRQTESLPSRMLYIRRQIKWEGEFLQSS